jgi:ABC-type nitrate/sulfonate/bicarbonate transport system substrate-binding protein
LGIETKTFKTQELGIPTYYEMLVVANQGSRESTPPFVLAFQRALQKSIDFCRACPDEAFACFIKHNPDSTPQTIHWQQEAWRMTLPLLAKDQIIDKDIVKNFYLWQIAQGIIHESFDISTLWDL